MSQSRRARGRLMRANQALLNLTGSETLSAGAGTEPEVKAALDAARTRTFRSRSSTWSASGVVFTASSAASKWLVAIYPIGEVLFARTLRGADRRRAHSCCRPAASRSFARARLGAHAMRACSQAASQIDAAGRLQPDAARRRDRDHVLLADLHHARLGLFPAREGRRRRAGPCCSSASSACW